MSLKSKIESLLLVSNYPLSLKKLAELTEEKREEVKLAINELIREYQAKQGSGIAILESDDKVQMSTSPQNAKIVQNFIKDETTGELTRASLETLTIIAYRGPITRSELEKIRGVNCAIILRNLMMRGLIETKADNKKMENIYNISMDFIKFLGITDISQLPDYERLNKSKTLDQILQETPNP